MKLHDFWTPFPEMKEALEGVASKLREVQEDSPALIRNELAALLSSPGKMLRPAFALLASNGHTGGTGPSLISVAAAIELLHMATLIHDDVMDGAATRRGKPTLRSSLGVKQAVLAGDYLLARAMIFASEAYKPELQDHLNRGIAEICLSEIDQDSGLGDYSIDRESYYARISGKTAELFALSCRVGAILGGKSPEDSEAYYRMGREFGLAFQIFDDVADYRSSLKDMGKPSGNDLKDGIPTLPLILALESGDRNLKKLCDSRFKYVLRGVIRKRVLAGGYDEAAENIAVSHLTESRGIATALDFPGGNTFLKILERFGPVPE